MTPKLKNALLFLGIAVVLILVYVFLFRGDNKDEADLVSSSATPVPTSANPSEANSALARDFLSLLLNIKSIKLDDSIFSDPAFLTLRDSSIVLVPDGNEGRPNPFAPIGSDIISSPAPAPSAPTTLVPPASGPTAPI